MKRRRVVPVGTRRRLHASSPAEAAEGEMLPIGRVPADDARDNLMLQRLAWPGTDYSGLAVFAIIAVVVAIRAVVVDLAAWIIRGFAGRARPANRARPHH